MKPAPTLITALLFAPLAALQAADNPFTSAKAVWRMTAEGGGRTGSGRSSIGISENVPTDGVNYAVVGPRRRFKAF